MVHGTGTNVYLSYIRYDGDGLHILVHKSKYHNRTGIELKEQVSPYTGVQQNVVRLAVFGTGGWASKS